MKNYFKVLIIFIILIGVGVVLFSFSKNSREKDNSFQPLNVTDLSETKNLPKEKMQIFSSAFENNSFIPSKYTCDGENINPPLEIKNIPEEAQSLVLIVDDPDASKGTFLHWLVWNIKPRVSLIEENSLPEGAIQGKNGFGKEKYGGPCPPSGIHRYFFKIYALDKKLDLPFGSRLSDLEKATEGHILSQSQIFGFYQRR